MLKIDTSLDWVTVRCELLKQIQSVNFNSDVNKIFDNIGKMVVELNKAEVEARRIKSLKYIQPKIDEINTAIEHLEIWILVLALRQ
jgi:hypothetical protein